MPVLLYGVTESRGKILPLPLGVDNKEVRTLEISDLTCFYATDSSLNSADVQESALAYNHILQTILSTQDVIPFRFPTLLADEAELASRIREHARQYHEWLARIHGRVQMEIRIRKNEPGGVTKKKNGKAAGAEYLRQQRDRRNELNVAAAAFRNTGQNLIQDWKQRESTAQVLCFALVDRGSVTQLKRAFATAQMPQQVTARISGPWAPTNFFEEER